MVIRTPGGDAKGVAPAFVAAGRISRFRTVARPIGEPVFGVQGTEVVGAPLMELEESLVFGMFPTRLLIFDDRIEVRGFELLREKVQSKDYDRVDRVVVSGEGWLANLVISEKGGRPILIRGVDRGDAERAGALIGERVTRATGSPTQATPTTDEGGLIRNLTELRDAGVLSEEEFEAKRRAVMRAGESEPPDGGRQRGIAVRREDGTVPGSLFGGVELEENAGGEAATSSIISADRRVADEAPSVGRVRAAFLNRVSPL